MKETRWSYFSQEMHTSGKAFPHPKCLRNGNMLRERSQCLTQGVTARCFGRWVLSNRPRGSHLPPCPWAWGQGWLHVVQHSPPLSKITLQTCGEGGLAVQTEAVSVLLRPPFDALEMQLVFEFLTWVDSLKSRFLACFLCPSHLRGQRRAVYPKAQSQTLNSAPYLQRNMYLIRQRRIRKKSFFNMRKMQSFFNDLEDTSLSSPCVVSSWFRQEF